MRPEGESSSSGQGPYREAELSPIVIEPDHRGRRAVVLALVSMVAGAALYGAAGSVLRARAAAPVATSSAARVAANLSGPGGEVALPGERGAVVHVWLQGCADCMPAFEAHKRMVDAGGLGVTLPIVNVAYGEVSTEWAKRYGLGDHLVSDSGAQVVQPLGISSFTTLVIDRRGRVVLRDRPDQPGYLERVRTAASVVVTMQQ